ncbi:putative sensor histidine kinase [Roseivivax marinus]|uniref:histidine kinase n=1 Tax=Roseivivax marinus TaxID=1379903 RepID=W4HDZ8_9RHOB|nr:PAS domain S-box protein [Roseivivax marinus]ETW10638.1 putative sensor histidine kinase [Roseivivax marinus]
MNSIEHLAAIVENSDDAIVAKNLDSIILSWNQGAERLFGYSAEEAIGQSITMLIPEDRQHEEVDFIARLARGERIQQFETIRQRKDGTLVPISLTVSPVRDASGKIIGASKIARDMTAHYAAAEQQRMLVSEMRHRVGNCFAVAAGLLAMTAREVDTANELAKLMRERLLALSTAHKMAVVDPQAKSIESASLRDLVLAILEPFAKDKFDELRIEDIAVCPSAITPIALIFYELCTNAMKYGALRQTDGAIAVEARAEGDRFTITWQERCKLEPASEGLAGFGTKMCDNVVRTSLGGTISRKFGATGMAVKIDLELAQLEA